MSADAPKIEGNETTPPGTATATELLAELLTATPHLRARFLSNPTREIGKLLPKRKYWIYDDARTHSDLDKPAKHASNPAPATHRTARHETSAVRRFFRKPLFHPIKFVLKRREHRARFAERVLLDLAVLVKSGRLAAVVNTDAVFEDYFAPIVRSSRQGFTVIFALSIGVFAAGCGLIGAGVFLVYNDPSTNSTVAASIFGGGGAVAALGSIFTLSKAGIRQAVSDHARLRLALTGFATELGQLRWLADSMPGDGQRPLDHMKDVLDVNVAIQASMTNADTLFPIPEPDTTSGQRTKPTPTTKKGTNAKPKVPPRAPNSTTPVHQ